VAQGGVALYCLHFFSRLCVGDWGDSVAYSRPVRELIVARIPTTLRSVAAGLGGAWIGAVALSFALSLVRRGVCGAAVSALTGLLLCVPAAVIGVLAIYVESGPALAIAVILWPRLVVQLRAITGAVARQPHVLAARARGVGGARLVAMHIWRPALPQLLALAAVMVNHAVSVAIPVETICDSPGLGQMMWQAATARDLPLLVHLTLLVALATAAANLAGDAGRAALRGTG
jgi:peptide/nickel transport system permease protein